MYVLDFQEIAKDKDKIVEELEKRRSISHRRDVSDDDIHMSWIHAAIYEMAAIPRLEMSPKNIQLRLIKNESLDKIKESLVFLESKGWIESNGENRYKQNPIEFDPKYDQRSVEIMLAHKEYLDMAKHRLNDSVKDTEFLGMTMAIKKSSFKRIQKIIREAADEIELACQTDHPDQVIAVQLNAFQLMK